MAHQLNGGFNLQQVINNHPHTDMELGETEENYTQSSNQNNKRSSTYSPHKSPQPKKPFNNNITATGQPPHSPDNSTPNYEVPSQTQSPTQNLQNSASQLPAPTEYTSDILPPYKIIIKSLDNTDDKKISPIKIARNLIPLYPNGSFEKFKK